MPKLIIEYPEDMEASVACWNAMKHVEQGRISEARGIDHFCWVSIFNNGTECVTRNKRHPDSADSIRIRKTNA